jgi:CheY-like chemotaxis protein
MPHAFDGHGFGKLLGDLERLFVGTVEQHRLTEVLTLFESEGSASLERAADLRATMRRLRAIAHEQQQLTGTLLARLVGARAAFSGSRRQRVLIVDDSDGSRETAAAILEDAGFDAITATNGLEGVIVAHYALPAVVLMDLTMPVLGGLEAARLLRASMPTRHLKVIAFTARPDIHEESVARSFADILSKPAAPETIIATVQRFVTPDRLADVESEGPAA